MWILTWKNYALSKFATFLSVVGTLTRYGGVLCFSSSVIPAGIICLAIGIGFHFLAEFVAFNKWKEQIRAKGFEQKVIQGDLQAAIQVYNSNTGKKALKYIESLNSQIASQITVMINNNKKES